MDGREPKVASESTVKKANQETRDREEQTAKSVTRVLEEDEGRSGSVDRRESWETKESRDRRQSSMRSVILEMKEHLVLADRRGWQVTMDSIHRRE